MEQNRILQSLPELTKQAVSQYWQTRAAQRQKQEQSGRADQGLRSAVTGGAQMDGFIFLFTELIRQTEVFQRLYFQEEGR